MKVGAVDMSVVVGKRVPRKGGPVTRWLGRMVLQALGFRIEGTLPDLAKFVVIAAPHTSNWDFVIGMAARWVLSVDARWLGKDKLFWWPFGYFLQWLGGTPVDRSSSNGVVDQVVGWYRDREQLIVGLSPEGTRKKVDRWRTGFYHIARGAGVPILLAYFDYGKKTVGFGPLMNPTGNVEADMKEMIAFYRTKPGKYPDQF